MEDKKVVKVNGYVTVETATSKKGNEYKAVYVTIGDKHIQLGFVNAFTELALIKAGVKLD